MFLKNFSLIRFFFFFFYFSSFILILSSDSFIMQWMSLEYNMFSFIPLCCLNQSNEMKLSQSVGIYFLCQSMFSLIFLSGLVNSWFFVNFNFKLCLMLMMLGLLGKLGMFPLYFWIPKVVLGFGSMNNFLLFSFQKLGPLLLFESVLVYSKLNNLTFISLAIFTFLVSSILGSFQTCLMGFMSYSSVGHSGWMILTVLHSLKMSILYLMFYSFVLFFFFFF